MNYDIMQALFWSAAYLMIIYTGIRYKDEYLLSMPVEAGILIFSWEIVALIQYFPNWIHIVWTALDILIFTLNCRILARRKAAYCIGYLIALAALIGLCLFLLSLENGMLISSFVIDILMAVVYLVRIKKLSPHFRLLIGLTKLIGDFFAWLAYKDILPIINIIGIAVLVINLTYVLYAYYLYLKTCRKQMHYK